LLINPTVALHILSSETFLPVNYCSKEKLTPPDESAVNVLMRSDQLNVKGTAPKKVATSFEKKVK
jgi:hypothetical protein